MEEFKLKASEIINQRLNKKGANYLEQYYNELHNFPIEKLRLLALELNLDNKYSETEISEVITELRIKHFNKMWS